MSSNPAENIQSFLKTRFQMDIPVFYEKYGLTGDFTQPCIRHTEDWTAGDIYIGYTTFFNVILQGFYRPDNNNLLEINIEYSIHDLSGQYDDWKVTINGALESEKEMLIQVIKPIGFLSDSIRSEINFNGIQL
jgi:hypothetical protein